MRIEQDFKGIRKATAAALILSALALAFICIAPQVLIRGISEEIGPKLELAKELVKAEMTDKAVPHISEIRRAVEEKGDVLMFFFDHSRLLELKEACLTAELLAEAGDVTQLLSELGAIEAELEYLLHLNEAGIFNLL